MVLALGPVATVIVSPAPVRVPIQLPIVPSVMSVTSSANDKNDNEMIPGLYTSLKQGEKKHPGESPGKKVRHGLQSRSHKKGREGTAKPHRLQSGKN